MKKYIIAVLAVYLSFNSTQVLAQNEKFDLVCTGSQKSNFASNIIETTVFNVRISINLDRMLYSMKGAKYSSQIYHISPDTILLEKKSTKFSREEMSVNRVNGEFLWMSALTIPTGSKRSEMIGKCQRAEFTELPITLF